MSRSQQLAPATQSPSVEGVPALDAVQDFGSNSAAIDEMGAVASQGGPTGARVTVWSTFERFDGIHVDSSGTIDRGSKNGLEAGTKVTAPGFVGHVSRVYPFFANVHLYGTSEATRVKSVGLHPGEHYSLARYRKEQADERSRNAKREADKDADREYKKGNRSE